LVILVILVNLGSPPRAWGQLFLPDAKTTLRRFTPTGVGTTPNISAARPVASVHPHGRGDNMCGMKRAG